MDPSLIVALVLIVAAGLALELRISSAIMEILAGVLLALFLQGVSSLEWMLFLSQMGVLGLMFMAGFEVDVERLRDTWRASVAIGVLSLAFPFTGVFLLARYGVGMSVQASGLLGVALSTTSLALVYHALKERGIIQEQVGQVLLSAASVVDVLSMVVLALFLGKVGWGTAIFLLVALPALLGLPQAGKWLFQRYRGSVVEFEMRFLLVILVGMGFLAERAGIHSAVIAFAVGVVMSEVVADHEVLEEKLKGVVFSFFAPIFFLHAGTRLDLRQVDGEALLWALAFFAVAVSLKFLGTALPARRLINVSGRFAGILFNYRLSFGIIAASVGLETRLLTPALYSVVLLVVVGSAALPVLLLRDRPFELDE